jgi:hypothetical protein
MYIVMIRFGVFLVLHEVLICYGRIRFRPAVAMSGVISLHGHLGPLGRGGAESYEIET